MLFSSCTFLFIFLPIILILYYIAQDKYKNLLLLIASLLFYSWGEPKFVVLMLISIIFNYFFAILINKFNESKNKNISRIILIISLILNIGLLFMFKYLNFIIVNII